MEKEIIKIDKIQLIEAIRYNLEVMSKFTGGNHKIKLDYNKERFVCTAGIIFKTVVSDKSFDEIIDDFLNKNYSY